MRTGENKIKYETKEKIFFSKEKEISDRHFHKREERDLRVRRKNRYKNAMHVHVQTIY